MFLILQSTKRALIELISNLELDLHTDGDNLNGSQVSDLDDSSGEGGVISMARAAAAAAAKEKDSAAVGVFGPGNGLFFLIFLLARLIFVINLLYSECN